MIIVSGRMFGQGFSGVNHLRTGGACRSKVAKKLSHEFKSVTDAESHFKKLVAQEKMVTTSLPAAMETQPLPQSELSSEAFSPSAPIPQPFGSTSMSPPSLQAVVGTCHQALQPLELKEMLTVLSILFSTLSAQNIPSDFL